MKANLSRRLLLWAGLPAAILFVAVFALSTYRSQQQLIAETEQVARGLCDSYAAGIELHLNRASKIPEEVVLTLERGLLRDEQGVEDFLREVLLRNEEVYGTCVAFEPSTFSAKERLYGPYWYRATGEPKFEQLGKPEYNYLDEKWEWYARAKKEGLPLWTEPYFDDGGGNAIMSTYSVPFYHGADHRLWGVATIDIAMSQLMREVSAQRVGETGYSFLISKQGRFLAFPDRSKIMTATLQSLDPGLAKMMAAGTRGFVRRAEPHQAKPAWIAFTPIGKNDFALAIVYPEAEVLAAANRLKLELTAVGLLGLLAVLGALFIVARSISSPITALADAARRLAAGELDHEVQISARTEEVQHLANAFRKMTRDLKMRMAELRYTTMVNERIEGELSAARSIQMSLVAKTFPAFPGRSEFDLHAIIKPARQVGGDFYDFYFVSPDELCLIVADVAGKGVPAALYMSVSKTLLRANMELATEPLALLAKVNNELCEQSNDSGMFVSLCLALLDVRTGRVRLASAGHPPPLSLVSSGKTASTIVLKPGVALGAWRSAGYYQLEYQLAPGEALLFYTDGITEALDDAENFYTVGRLERVFGGMAEETMEDTTRRIAQDVRAFSSHREQSDDLTLLGIRWIGPQLSS